MCKWGNFFSLSFFILSLGFPGGAEVKASTCNVGDLDSIPGSGRSPREGNGNPLQYSCLENPMDGGAWWATVHRSQRVDTTKRLHFHLYFLNFLQMHLFHDNLKANKYLLENGPSPDTIEVGHCRFIFLVCI